MEKIMELENKLLELKNRYNQMKKGETSLASRIETIDAIINLSGLLEEEYKKKIGSIYKECEEYKSLIRNYKENRFDRDLFFARLLFGLNINDNNYEACRLKFDEYGHQGRGAMGSDEYGINYYDYTIVAQKHLIDIFKEMHKISNSILWFFIKKRINEGKDLIIYSDFYSLPEFNSEQRKIEFSKMGEGYYYKGDNRQEIDFVLDKIDECAWIYGVDFNEEVLGSRLIKK